MPFLGLFSRADRLLERALDGVSARQRVTAHNIANVDTPGFKRYRLPFEEHLKAALAREPRRELVGTLTHPRHIAIGGGSDPLAAPFRAERVAETAMRNDGNNVDIEAEMAQVVKDQILYAALAQEATRRYAMLRSVITEGRR